MGDQARGMGPVLSEEERRELCGICGRLRGAHDQITAECRVFWNLGGYRFKPTGVHAKDQQLLLPQPRPEREP